MANSKAQETCAFAHLVEKEGLEIRGITLTPDWKVTHQDISQLIHNGNKLPEHVKQKFIEAHREHTVQLF